MSTMKDLVDRVRESREIAKITNNVIVSEALDIYEEIQEEFQYGGRKQWDLRVILNDLDSFNKICVAMEELIMLIELYFQMENDQDQFVIQKMIHERKEEFECWVNDDIVNISKVEGPWGRKDRRYVACCEQMQMFIKDTRECIESMLSEP